MNKLLPSLTAIAMTFASTTSLSAQDQQLSAQDQYKKAGLIDDDGWFADCYRFKSINFGFENGVEFIESKGFKLEDVYRDLRCDWEHTNLVGYFVKESETRSLLMLARLMVGLNRKEEFVEFISERTRWGSLGHTICPTEMADIYLDGVPGSVSMQAIQDILFRFGAKDCPQASIVFDTGIQSAGRKERDKTKADRMKRMNAFTWFDKDYTKE